MMQSYVISWNNLTIVTSVRDMLEVVVITRQDLEVANVS